MRQIVLDTETTGLNPLKGDRVIEIGCIEMINRTVTERYFHTYLRCDRAIEDGASRVHGLTQQFLADKPEFKEIAKDFLEFIKGAELIAHNAPFDIGFLDHELSLLETSSSKIQQLCSIFDTLPFARKKHPGQKNNLDALCKRYFIDASNRKLHGALVDAELLARLYLAMTSGQGTLSFFEEASQHNTQSNRPVSREKREPLPILRANETELEAHQRYMDLIKAKAGFCLWKDA